MIGTEVGICALHGEKRGPRASTKSKRQEGSQKASAGCASLQGAILLALGKKM